MAVNSVWNLRIGRPTFKGSQFEDLLWIYKFESRQLLRLFYIFSALKKIRSQPGREYFRTNSAGHELPKIRTYFQPRSQINTFERFFQKKKSTGKYWSGRPLPPGHFISPSRTSSPTVPKFQSKYTPVPRFFRSWKSKNLEFAGGTPSAKIIGATATPAFTEIRIKTAK